VVAASPDDAAHLHHDALFGAAWLTIDATLRTH
jgi:hypothetical protein